MEKMKAVKMTDPLNVGPGRFSTLINIGHTPEFFALDFRAVTPESEACLLGRYFLTPQHAKRLLQALTHHVAGFENEFGTIDPGKTPVQSPSSN